MHDLAVIGNGLKYFFTFSCVRNSHVSKAPLLIASRQVSLIGYPQHACKNCMTLTIELILYTLLMYSVSTEAH